MRASCPERGTQAQTPFTQRLNTAKLSNNQEQGQGGTSPPSSPGDHRPIMQSLPDTRQQSFDEIYGPPENFLEIEVRYRPQYEALKLRS